MKKNKHFRRLLFSSLKKTFLIMRIAAFLLILGILQAYAVDSYSQRTKLSLDFSDTELIKVLDNIEVESEFYFFYNEKLLDTDRKVSIDISDQSINTILDNLFAGTDVKYTIIDRKIILTPDYLNKNTNVVVNAQQHTVTGTVTDESSGDPMPGVNILVKGTTIGAISDATGKYSLVVPARDATLVFSFIGYVTQEIPLNGRATIDISLVSELKGLDEVVIVGYGTQKKANVVGSMVSIQGDDINKISVTSFAEGLQGLASGMMVTNTSGHPGSAPDIKIRGIHSISLSSDPLWIVDGMPIHTGSSEIMRDGVKGVSAISMLNPDDIKSIEILKDAAATAIYGSRASAGVILVTTKSAEKGRAGVRLNYDGGLSQIPFSQNDIFVDSKTWWELSDQCAENLGIVAQDPNNVINTKIIGYKPQMTKEEAIATNTDHLRAITKDALFHQFGLTANKSFEAGGVMLSLNYRDEEGLIRNNDFQRLTSRFSLNLKPLKIVDMGITSNFIYLKSNGVRSVGGKSYGGWANWHSTLPWFKIYDENDPTGYWAGASGYNLMANSDRNLQRFDVDQYRSINNAFVQLSPLKGLMVKGEVGVDLLVNNSSFWRSGLLVPLAPNHSLAEEKSVTKSIINYAMYANYNTKFYHVNSVDFTIGMESSRDWSYTRNFAGSGLQTIYPELRNPLVMSSMAGYQGGDTYLMGFFARANYQLLDRYLLNLSVRRDGHSAFSEKNRWANFYAVGAGWILTNEKFMKDLSLLSLLKLRGSYGITGNTKVSNTMTYMHWGLDTKNKFGVDVSPGSTTIGPLGSTGLKWETTTNTDFGADFGILNNRINGSIAFYKQTIKDLILLGAVQPSVGYDQNFIYENVGNMKNWGLEFNFKSSNIVRKKFRWETDFNISTNKNKIISLNEAEKGQGKIENRTIRKEGEALNTYFLANYTSIDTEKGIPMIEKRNDDLWNSEYKTESTGVIIPATKSNVDNNRMIQHGKTSLPTFYGGLSNVFTYKNFDLNILLNFEGGHWLWNDLYSTSWTAASMDNNTIKEIVGNTWVKPGDVAEWPQLLDGTGIYYDNEGNPSPGTKYTINFNQSTRFLEKGDYIRVRNFQLGYTLPESVCNKISLNSVRFYMGVTNLFTITGYKGLDPESLFDLPIPRTFNFGISFNL